MLKFYFVHFAADKSSCKRKIGLNSLQLPLQKFPRNTEVWENIFKKELCSVNKIKTNKKEISMKKIFVDNKAKEAEEEKLTTEFT